MGGNGRCRMDWLIAITKEYGLFVALVVYVIWDSREREKKYIDREQKYIAIIETIKDIKDDVLEIKNKFFGKE